MDPIIVKKVLKVILDKSKNVTLCCNIIHINWIGFLNIISQNILFDTGSMIKNRKTKNIEEGIKQVKKLYLKCGFKITRIHDDSEFETLRTEVADIGIYLSFFWSG